MRNPLGGGIGKHGRRGGYGARIRPVHARFLVMPPLLVAAALARADVDVWTFTGPGGGTVRTLAVDSSVMGVLYAGTEQGGVFKSSDGGVSWGTANRGLPSRADVRAVATDPADPMRLYAATHSTGVFRSGDAAAQWSAASSGLSSLSVNTLAVPAAITLYAGTTDGGVFKSIDGGTNWVAVNAGLANVEISFLAFDPSASTTVYAATQGAGVFKTTDSGAHWQAATAAPRYVNALAIDPSSGATLYAGTSDGLFALHRTDLDPSRATPTPTPTADPRCAPDQITLVPSSAPPGARVMLSGQCYFLHSGRRADVFFDTIPVGAVTGDTGGRYALAFNVPGDALPGPHQVRVVGAQSVTLVVQSDDNIPTPTPTFGGGGLCPSDNMTVVPNAGPVGTRVVVSGQCYYLHSGRGGEIFFDDTSVGRVQGDTPGNWSGGFVVPIDAVPGTHFVKLVAFGGTYQSATFEAEAIAEPPSPSSTPTATRTPTPTAIDTATTSPTRTATASATSTSSTTLSSATGGAGGCAMSPDRNTADASLIFLYVPAALLMRRLVQRRNRVLVTSSQGGKRS
jgi:hypothetical protein